MEEPSATELHNEHVAIRRQYRALASVSLLLLIGGAAFFHYTEHFSWINALYFCTMTLTTVGYGDIVPKTDAGKIFDMGYVVVGIGIIATFANLLVKNAIIRRQIRTAAKKKGM
jgi:voltage-gated potassium channel Kch